MQKNILTALEDSIFSITLNRPEKLNCLNTEMLQNLDSAVSEAEGNKQAKVVVIKGAGEKSFSSGGDLNEFRTLTKEGIHDWIRLGHAVFNHIESIPKPTIAVIHGYAYGGGLELALACDMRIASEKAAFCSPELKHGWIPGWGGMARLKRIIGEAKAKELLYCGDVLNAAEAEKIGLVNRCTGHENIMSEANSMARKLSELDGTALGIIKTALQDTGRQTFGADVMYDILATLSSGKH